MNTAPVTVHRWSGGVEAPPTRDEVAVEYVSLIRANGTTWTGYAEINKAIMRRWSMAALRYIKEKAWRLATA